MLYNEVAVQEEIKASLIKSINNNQISHCYIFEGPSGMGKYELAMIFAQSLFCEDFNENPCNKCKNCIKINSRNHPDLHVINIEEKAIKREEIDELIASIYRKPYEANKKIYIIKKAHEMTLQAANTFLKTLEEPPKNTVIVLLTTNVNLLLPTIVSRCQLIKFRNVSKEIIKNYLKENYDADEEKLNLAVEYSNGILNKAVNIIKNNDNILQERKDIIKIIDKIINQDSEIIYDLESYFEENKDNIDKIIEIMMMWIRDCMLVKNNINDLIINKDLMQLAVKHSELMSQNNSLIEVLQNTSDNIKNNVNYKLAIDNMLLKIQEVF